jgi:Cu/Ag efflux protein CusF
MRTNSASGACAAVLLAVAVVAGCHASSDEGDGTGIVRAFGAGGATITLEHGDIPGVMAAMTMDYAVAKPELLAGIEVGETVAFHLVHENGVYTVTELREANP